MLERLSKLFKRNPRFWGAVAISFLILIAYGQTLGMYFWQDDSALIFKLQNPAGAAGSFGAGIIGSGAYKYLVLPFVPFYKIFGLEPMGYFAVGLLTYLLATAAFYLFASEFFKNKKAGFIATLIFAAGYVGSETMFRIINSWQTNAGLTLALVAFWLFTKYLREGGLAKYLTSVALFLATLELVFIRSHSLILPVLALDVLLRFIPPRAKELPRIVLRQIPFWFLWRSYYLTDASFGGPGIKSLIERIFQGELVTLAPLLANIGNILVPDILQTKLLSFLRLEVFGASVLLTFGGITLVWFLGRIWQASAKVKLVAVGFLVLAFLLNQSFYAVSPLWYRDVQSVVAGLVGLDVSILTLYAAIGLWSKNKTLAIALPFGLIVLVSQFFGYYTQYPTSILATTHRYFSYSFIGYSIIFGGIAYLLLQNFRKQNLRRWAIAPLVFLVGTNLILGFRYQSRIAEERSLPSRKFYQDLKKFVPQIEKGAAFYFDIVADPFYQRQFGDFFSVGSMPESTAIAIYYGVDRYELTLVTDFDELVSEINLGEIDLAKTYTFFYGKGGLVDTTKEMRGLLASGSGFEKIVSGQKPENLPLVPTLVEVTARISPLPAPENFPASDSSGSRGISAGEKIKMLGYLAARNSYYRQARASSLSEWKFREARNAVDQDNDSVWQGHRIWWHDNQQEQLTIDLGRVLSVGRILWRNWTASLSPTAYSFEVSLDGQTWERVLTVDNGPERKNGELVVEDFVPRRARFVRMDINATLTDDSPAISEFEVAEARYAEIDQDLAEKFFANPFGFVTTRPEWDALYKNIAPLAKIKLALVTDKGEVSKVAPLVLGGSHIYEYVVAAGGTRIENIKVTANIPVEIEIGGIKLRNLSVSELSARGLIKIFAEN